MTMADERSRILRMVAEGKVSPVEAEDLLAALEPRSTEGRSLGTPELGSLPLPPMPPMPPMPPRQIARRSLVIQISEGDQNKVNVRIPLTLARAAGKFIPRHSQQYLDNYDINLNQLLESLGSTTIEGDGTLVEIRDDDDTVRIAVE